MDDEREALGFIFVSILVTGGTVAYGLNEILSKVPRPKGVAYNFIVVKKLRRCERDRIIESHEGED